MPRLRDVLSPQPKLLLVGINPGLRSGALGHHFAGNGNPFWRLLYEARLIPRPLTHEEDQRLADFGIALTNLCARPTRAAAELTRDDIERGRRVLRQKCARLRPRVVAFVGLSVYQMYFRLPASGGAGAKPETIAGARVFVVPNPSGLNANFPGFQHKLVWFEALRRFMGARSPGEPTLRRNAPVAPKKPSKRTRDD
ncbi:MAG TPA: mismatch-specific DNA-glycosylase [Polyangiaceae bacterium]|nr:mismatch-specific DNA-glycosylase [Polyangiaceae bacterium]